MWRIVFAVLAPILAGQTAWEPDEVRSTNRLYEFPSPVTLRVQSDLVEVGVVVRDARGHVVSGLHQADFRIFDDGKERTITAFSVETATPPQAGAEAAATSSANTSAVDLRKPGAAQRNVVLYFDDFSIAPGDLARTKLAARRFVNETLDPSDRVAIFTSSSTQFLDFTSDKEKILEMLGKLSAHRRIDENGLVSCPRITPYQAYLIVIHDPLAEEAAAYEAYVCQNGPPVPQPMDPGTYAGFKRMVTPQAEATWQQARLSSLDTLNSIGDALDRLSRVPGTRMLVLASSGFLTATLEAEQDRIVDRALRASVVIHALDAKGLYTETGRANREVGGGDLPLSTFIFEQTSLGSRLMEMGAAMAHLAESTGGLFLHDNNDLDASLRSLVPETTYRLGFAPQNAADDGKYHALKIRLTNPGTDHVIARRGYFTPPPTKPLDEPLPQLRDIDRVAVANDTFSDLPVRFVAEPSQHALGVTLVVEVRELTFVQRDARRTQKLSFVAMLFDEDGAFVSGKEGELSLALKDTTYAHFAETGISTRVSIPVPPGRYRLRGVVEDSAGKMTTSAQSVEVH